MVYMMRVGIYNLWQQLLFLGYGTNSRCIMGKLNVAVLRYLTKEDFRVLTAVGRNMIIIIYMNFS